MSNPTDKWQFLPLGIGLERETIKIVEALAEEENRTRSEMIRTLIHEALDTRMRATKVEVKK